MGAEYMYINHDVGEVLCSSETQAVLLAKSHKSRAYRVYWSTCYARSLVQIGNWEER